MINVIGERKIVGKIKNRLVLVTILILSVIFLSFGMIQCSETPELHANVVLSSISQEDFNKIGLGSKLPEAKLDDFRKLTIDIAISNSKLMINREISIPDVYYIIDHYDRFRTSMGGGYEQNNIRKEDFAKSYKYVVFDARGLTKEDYSKMFNGLNISVNWTYKNGETVKNILPIASLLQDESKKL